MYAHTKAHFHAPYISSLLIGEKGPLTYVSGLHISPSSLVAQGQAHRGSLWVQCQGYNGQSPRPEALLSSP